VIYMSPPLHSQYVQYFMTSYGLWYSQKIQVHHCLPNRVMCIRIHQDLCDISCVAFIEHNHRHWNKQGPSLTIYGVIFHALSDSMFSISPACSFPRPTRPETTYTPWPTRQGRHDHWGQALVLELYETFIRRNMTPSDSDNRKGWSHHK
jgi:hypothetical protein